MLLVITQDFLFFRIDLNYDRVKFSIQSYYWVGDFSFDSYFKLFELWSLSPHFYLLLAYHYYSSYKPDYIQSTFFCDDWSLALRNPLISHLSYLYQKYFEELATHYCWYLIHILPFHLDYLEVNHQLSYIFQIHLTLMINFRIFPCIQHS